MTQRAVQPPWPEREPSWAQVVNRIIVRGRPQYLRNAASIYDNVFEALHSAADDIDRDLAALGQSWSGPAFDQYQRQVSSISAEIRRIIGEANEYGGIGEALRHAADRLYAYQQVIPIPNDCAGDVVRAHNEGLELTDHQIEEALRKEAESSGFFSFFFDFLEWLGDVINDNTGKARDKYRDLSSEYAVTAASAPDSVEPPRVNTPAGYTPRSVVGDIGSSGTYRPPGGLGTPTYVPGDDLSGGLGGNGLGGPGVGGLAGAGSGAGLAGMAGGGGLSAGGGKLVDTGAAFGTPVNLMGALPPGVGGMGMGMGMPMGAGAGGAGGGDGEGYSTWLTEDDDTWTRARDGKSVPPVLE